MNALAQVRHLLVNDVRRLRWMLVGYAACVALATVAAYSYSAFSPGWLELTPVLVFLTGFFVVASAVQADSPYRPDAFWVSRPIHPASVLGAKLVLAMLVLALPMAGLAWVLAQTGLPSDEYSAALGGAAVSLGPWLLLGMAVAGVTHDLRSFANVFVALMVFFLIGSIAQIARSGSTLGSSEGATALATMLFRAGPLVLLTFVYLKRDSLNRARAIGGALLAVWLVALLFSAPSRSLFPTKDVVIQPEKAPQVTLSLDPSAPGDAPGTLRLRVRGKPWRDAARLVVSVNSMLLHARDGVTVQVSRVPAMVVTLREPMPEGSAFPDLAVDSSFVLTLSEGERRRMAPGIESIEVIGDVVPYAMRVVAVLPFASGAEVQQGGTRFQLDSVQRDHVGSAAIVRTVTVRTQQQDLSKFAQMARVLPRFLLLEDGAHGAIRMGSRSSGTSGGWMILPGATIIRTWTQVEAMTPLLTTTAGSPVAPARLMVLEWKSLGQASLRVRLARE